MSFAYQKIFLEAQSISVGATPPKVQSLLTAGMSHPKKSQQPNGKAIIWSNKNASWKENQQIHSCSIQGSGRNSRQVVPQANKRVSRNQRHSQDTCRDELLNAKQSTKARIYRVVYERLETTPFPNTRWPDTCNRNKILSNTISISSISKFEPPIFSIPTRCATVGLIPDAC
ncbi:hypothetical protein HNY73_001122 [Argiope bruennichi]|uniref:Uncharacterized protein n=1 Tax=Argiope bruennichi TaxID=94029 RepID=A0A8T0G1D3_ARGBR|nr:hypothetical protein HNY73_001122 [Argiope bruennichi]